MFTWFARGVKTVIAASIITCLCVGNSVAQTWPTKPLRMVVPFPPGGTSDVMGRLIAQRLSDALGQPVVVDNRPGQGAVIGTNVVAKADPDGYTMLFGSSGALAAALSLYSKVPYDPVKDLAAVAIVADVTLLLAVNPKLPVNTVQELVALAKSKPGVLNVALPAVGSIHHLLTEQFKIDANIDMMNVPFNGSSPAAVALVTGTVDVEIDSLPTLLPFVKTGRLKGLAVASKTRSALVPDVPTMGEAGLPNIVASPWFTVMVPAGTPPQPIEIINSALAEISKIPAYREKMAALGANVRRSTPQEASTLIANEVSRWAQVAKKSGAKLE